MPRIAIGVLAVVAVGLLASPGLAQSTKYWPQLEIGFPVPQTVLELSPKPVKLRLYSATPNGRFEKVKELAADRLDDIPNRKPGFQYSAKSDGEEEFAVQLVYADGTVSPETDKLRTEFRVVFDTRPPAISLEPLGSFGVQWKVNDENLDSTSIKLECRWVGGDARWHEVKTRAFSAKDDYTWATLNKDNRVLEVRLSAKDKAGHESVSRIAKLPDSGGNARKDFNDEPRGGSTASDLRNSRSSDDTGGSQAQIVYMNRRDLTVKSKLTHITRSGVTKLHLYVKDLSAGSSGEWKFDKVQACDIKYEATDTSIEIAFTAAKDGRYGFIVIPESGVGRREPEPRASAPAQHLVEVDTVKPNVKIRSVNVTAGGTIGPRVEIEWDADDRNLMPDPIVLEYAADKSATTWLSIAEKVPNSRRYVWEVADKTMFKIYIRARATDKATNVGEHVYEQAVVIDLDKPSATIENIRGNGTAMPSERPQLVAPVNSPPVTLPSVVPGSPVTPPPVGAPDLLPTGR
ncbi:hypothetical protein BH11PLA2_BH11PLA2_21570 [soil metagenome]